MLIRKPEEVSPRPLDYATKLLTLALPAAPTRKLDQLRRDLTVLGNAARGQRPDPMASPDRAVRRAADLDHVVLLDLLGRRGESLRQAQRDVGMVGNALLRGRRGPPTVARRVTRDVNATETRGAAPLTVVPSANTIVRPLRVTRVVRETPDAVSLYVAETDGSNLEFTAGQFLSVDVMVAGERLRRAYSIAAEIGSEPHITIKRVEDGRVSNALNDEAKVGMHLDALGPSGAFTFDPASGAQKLLLIAGGSGITPVISIAETALRHSSASVTLLYGNRSEADIIFRDRLTSLSTEFGDRLRVEHVLSDASEFWAGARGVLDQETQEASLGTLGVTQESIDAFDAVYVCGPSPMMDASRELLTSWGADERLREERFSRPEDRTEGCGASTPQTARLHTEAGEYTVEVAPGKTLLEAASDAGIAMPFSCAMGGCGACKMLCTTGEVDMDEPNCLTRSEREAGYILTCISHPRTAVTLDQRPAATTGAKS